VVSDYPIASAVAGALADTPGIVSVYLFGSIAAGRARPGSDIDIGMVLDWRR
jgi:predicted nucleotidyltransferase